MNSPDDVVDLGEYVLAQLNAQGVGHMRVPNGNAFFFTRTTLEKLLVAAIEDENELAMILVKRGPDA